MVRIMRAILMVMLPNGDYEESNNDGVYGNDHVINGGNGDDNKSTKDSDKDSGDVINGDDGDDNNRKLWW